MLTAEVSDFADRRVALRCIFTPRTPCIYGRTSRPRRAFRHGGREAQYLNRVRSRVHKFTKPYSVADRFYVVIFDDTPRYDSLGIFVGFAAFFVMEKTLRVLGGEEGEAGHSHSHSQPSSTPSSGHSTGVASNVTANGLRARSDAPSSGKDELDMRPAAASSEDENDGIKATTGGPSKLSAYLNLFGDFVHNM